MKLSTRGKYGLYAMVYLAQKGYIEIRESVTNSKWSKDFVLVKQREYDGNKESERLFMQGLFMGRNTVSKKDLQNSFYRTINSIKSHVEKEYKKKIFYNYNNLTKVSGGEK